MIGASRSCEPLTLQLCEKWMSPPLSGCQSSLMRIGKGSAPHPPSMGPNVPKMRGMTQPLLIGLPLRGSCEPNIQPSSDCFWFRMYCHGTPKDPDPSALRAAVTSFPFQYKDEGVVQYRQIQEAVRVMWLAAQTSMTRYMRIPIPDGISEWGVDEQELPPNAGHAQPYAFPYHLSWPSLPASGLGWLLAIDSKLSSEGSY